MAQIILWSLVCLNLNACGLNVAKVFDDFSEKTTQVETVILAHEALIFNDISGNQNVIHIQNNVRALGWIHHAVKEIVVSKGYDVSEYSIWSVGLSKEPDTPLLVCTKEVDERPGSVSTSGFEYQTTPFVVKLFGLQETYTEPLGSLHRHLFFESEHLLSEFGNVKGMKGTFYPYTRGLDFPKNSVLIVTHSFGEQIPTGKKIGQFFLTLPFASGGGGGWESDYTYHLLYILRPETGELLWADDLYETGGNRSENELKRGLERLFSELPDQRTN